MNAERRALLAGLARTANAAGGVAIVTIPAGDLSDLLADLTAAEARAEAAEQRAERSALEAAGLRDALDRGNKVNRDALRLAADQEQRAETLATALSGALHFYNGNATADIVTKWMDALADRERTP